MASGSSAFIFLLQDLSHFLGGFLATACQPQFDDGVESVAEKFDVVGNMFGVKLQLRPFGIIDRDEMRTVITEFEIGVVKE